MARFPAPKLEARAIKVNRSRDGQQTGIRVSALTFAYLTEPVLKGVEFTLAKGAIGLLGPNGSGKTTLLRCLLGQVPLERGRVEVLGWDMAAQAKAARAGLGWMPERGGVIPGMSGVGLVAYMGELSGLPARDAMQRAHEVLHYVGLADERYRSCQDYSQGMKQRLKLAQAIVHDPAIVFLDEPTNGLDPRGQVQMLELVQSLWRDHGITVVLSSHLLHDVDRICEQIVIIARGQVLVHDRLEALKARRPGSAEVVLASRQADLVQACRRRQWPAELLPNGHVRVEHRAADLNPLLRLLHEMDLSPIEIIPSPNALEELFVQALETAHAPA